MSAMFDRALDEVKSVVHENATLLRAMAEPLGLDPIRISWSTRVDLTLHSLLEEAEKQGFIQKMDWGMKWFGAMRAIRAAAKAAANQAMGG